MSEASREHAILFSQQMCEAINAGRKSQTRRIIKGIPADFSRYTPLEHVNGSIGAIFSNVPEITHGIKVGTIYCPYGKPGDRLRFLSSWAVAKNLDDLKPTELPRKPRLWTHFAGEKPKWAGKTRPGRFMPLFLRKYLPSAIIESIRVQQIRDISRDDAMAEGVAPVNPYELTAHLPPGMPACFLNYETGGWFAADPIASFRSLWKVINGEESWKSNPWVWAVSFRMEAKA
jgi:hypothetical protein